MARPTFVAMFTALILGMVLSVFGQADPSDQYLQFFFQVQEAEKAEGAGDVVAAYNQYAAAGELLEAIKTSAPDFRPDLVNFRTRFIKDKLQTLKPLADAKRGAAPAPAPEPTPSGVPSEAEALTAPAPAPVPVPAPGGAPGLPVVDLPPGASNGDPTVELKTRVESLTRELDQTKADLAQTREELKRVQAERDDLKAKFEAAQQELANLKAGAVDKQVSQLLEENRVLKDKLGAAEAQLSALKSTDAQSALQAMQNQVSVTREQLQRAREENEAYQKTTSDLQAKLAEMQARLDQPAAPGSPEMENISKENMMLRDLIERQMKEQARREAAKKLALEELIQLKVQSDVLGRQIEILGSPLVELTDAERTMLRLPAPAPALASAGGAEPSRETISAPLEGDAPAAPSGKGAGLTTVPAVVAGLAKEANGFFVAKQFDEAAAKYEEILRQFPDNVYALSNLGVVRFQQGRFNESEEALAKAVRLAPQDAFSHSILGIVYYMTGRYDDAVTTLTRASTLDPNDAQTHNYLGIACSQKGWQSVAEQELRKAIEIDPKYADAHFNLAVVYATQKPPARELAKRHYEIARGLGIGKDPELEKLVAAP